MSLIKCYIRLGRLFHIFHLSLLRSRIAPKDMRIYILKFQRKYLYNYYNSRIFVKLRRHFTSITLNGEIRFPYNSKEDIENLSDYLKYDFNDQINI